MNGRLVIALDTHIWVAQQFSKLLLCHVLIKFLLRILVAYSQPENSLC